MLAAMECVPVHLMDHAQKDCGQEAGNSLQNLSRGESAPADIRPGQEGLYLFENRPGEGAVIAEKAARLLSELRCGQTLGVAKHLGPVGRIVRQ